MEVAGKDLLDTKKKKKRKENWDQIGFFLCKQVLSENKLKVKIRNEVAVGTKWTGLKKGKNVNLFNKTTDH